MSLCEENCELIGYNYTSKRVKCYCVVKLEVSENHVIKFNKQEFFKNFININNIANLNVIKCYKTVLKLKDLIKNYGCYIISIIMIFYFVALIIFYSYSFNKLKIDIAKIIFALKDSEIPQANITNNINVNNIIIHTQGNKKKNNKKKINNKKINKKINETETKNKIKNTIFIQSYSKYYIENSTQKIKSNGTVDKVFVDKNKTLNQKTLELKDFEMNSLDYEKARILDKRNFCQCYISLLKYNHPILFSFMPSRDYNSQIIKTFLFFFSFSLDFIVNTFFFTDDTMHKIYEDKGKFNFLNQIPQIMYSSLISRLIDTFIRMLALSQDNIAELKHEKEKRNLVIRSKRTIKVIKLKSILFFIIDFIILTFFWYYETCFCGIYSNTQTHLIKDSFISFSISFIYPFGIYLIISILRISALKAEKKDGKYLYKFSSILDSILA